MELYRTINNVNGGAQNDLHELHVMCIQQSDIACSRGVDLLALSECINKHLTGVQRQATGHHPV